MEARKGTTSLFDVYLRLRPHAGAAAERFLEVEPAEENGAAIDCPTHITITPPSTENRKRAVEKFGFTRVFNEHTTQKELFNGTALLSQIAGVLAADGSTGRDGLVATLGVTGSGKSHTILGSKSQRGVIQMTLDTLFRSIQQNITNPGLTLHDIAACDVSEAQISLASAFLQSMYGDGDSRMTSRAQTPLLVSTQLPSFPSIPSQTSIRDQRALAHHMRTQDMSSAQWRPAKWYSPKTIRPVTGFAHIARSEARRLTSLKETQANSSHAYPVLPSVAASRKGAHMPKLAALPQSPRMDDVMVAADRESEYAVVMSMYEVYNDRIFDLLAAPAPNSSRPIANDARQRRPLLFKSTEYSPNRKVVAGLRKVVCSTLEEALLVLQAGIQVRTVAGTGSNAVSSRSHGFVCIEVKKRPRAQTSTWVSNTLTVVDLAGSERARNAKTAGATLAEAGKINESLMYLGQCMQMQSSNSANLAEQLNTLAHTSTSAITNPKLVPFRQCKLTELLFSNSFSAGRAGATQQKAIMIVTADPCGDYSPTYQILRYSTLAREVTVPRIPSVSSTIGIAPRAPSAADGTYQRPTSASEHNTILSTSTSTIPSRHAESLASSYSYAYSTATSVSTSNAIELETLRIELAAAQDEIAAKDDVMADMKASFEERLIEQEEEVRAEVSEAYEGIMSRMRAADAERWETEAVERERVLDEKIDILTRGAQFEIFEDSPEDADASSLDADEARRRCKELRDEVRMLKQRLERAEGTKTRTVKSLKGKKVWGPDELGQENW